jgi:hypothetical protein
MATDDPTGPLPAELAAALDRHGIGPTLATLVEAMTARRWHFTLGVRYGDPAPIAAAAGSNVIYWATTWIGSQTDPAATAQGEGASLAEAVGWACVQLLGEGTSPDIDEEGRDRRWVRWSANDAGDDAEAGAPAAPRPEREG